MSVFSFFIFSSSLLSSTFTAASCFSFKLCCYFEAVAVAAAATATDKHWRLKVASFTFIIIFISYARSLDFNAGCGWLLLVLELELFVFFFWYEYLSEKRILHKIFIFTLKNTNSLFHLFENYVFKSWRILFKRRKKSCLHKCMMIFFWDKQIFFSRLTFHYDSFAWGNGHDLV